MNDAADKIEARLSTVTGQAGPDGQAADARQARKELVEIIGWVPEIAADTSLREPDWNSIHTACEQILSGMKNSGDVDRVKPDLQKLCVKLRELNQREGF